MAYTKEELLKLSTNKDIDALRKKVVSINIFDKIENINFDSSVTNQIDFTMELYQEYIARLEKLTEHNLQNWLIQAKNNEIIDNQYLEIQNRDKLLLDYQKSHHSIAMNYLIKRLINDKDLLTSKILIKAHEILLRGVAEKEGNIRKANNFFVGYYENNQNVIEFFPISCDEIKQAISLLLEYYNKASVDDNPFIKSYTIHGLLAALQLFEDGNTRLGRAMQHVSILDNTNNLLGKNYKLPILYSSNTYTPFRKEYRDLIANLALNPDEENWNKWYLFNLRRTQDQLFANEMHLQRIKK